MGEVADKELKVYLLLVVLPVICAELLTNAESNERKVSVHVGYDANSRPAPMSVVSRQTRSTRRLGHVSRPRPPTRISTNRHTYLRRRPIRQRHPVRLPRTITPRRPIRLSRPISQRRPIRLHRPIRRRHPVRLPTRRRGFRNHPKNRPTTRRPLRRKMRPGFVRRRKYKSPRDSKTMHHSPIRKPGKIAMLRNPVPRRSPIRKPTERVSTKKLTKTRQASNSKPTTKPSSSTVGVENPNPTAGKNQRKLKKRKALPPMFSGILQSIMRLKALQQKYKKMNITRLTTPRPSIAGSKKPPFVPKLRPMPPPSRISVSSRKKPGYTNLKKPAIMTVFTTKRPYSWRRPYVTKRPIIPSRSHDILTEERQIDKVRRISPRKGVIMPTRRSPRKEVLAEKEPLSRSNVAPQRSHCRKPPHILHGHIKTPSSYSHGSKVIYSCKKGYKLVGIATHLCKSDGKWSGKTPTCINDEKSGNKTDLKGQLTKITKDINDIEETSNGKILIAGVVALVFMLLFLTCHCIRVSTTRRALSDKHEEVVKEGLIPECDVPGVFEVSNGLCKKLCCCDSGLPTSFRPRKSRSRTSTSSLRNREENLINSLSRTSVRSSRHGSLHKVGGVSSRTSARSKPSYDSMQEKQISSSSRSRVGRSELGASYKVGGVSSKMSAGSRPSYSRIQENERLIDEEAIQADYSEEPLEAMEEMPRHYEEEVLPQYIDRRISQSQKGADMPRYYMEECLPEYIDRRIAHSQNGVDRLRNYEEEILTQNVDRKISQGQQEEYFKESSADIEAMPGYYEEDVLPEYADRQTTYQSRWDSDTKDINENSFIRYYNANVARKMKHAQRKLRLPKYTKNQRKTSTSPYFQDRKKVKLADNRKTQRKSRFEIGLSPISRYELEFVPSTKMVLPDVRQEKKIRNQNRLSSYSNRNRNTNTNIDSSEELSKLPLYNARQSLLTYKDYQEYMRGYDYLNTDKLHTDNKMLTSTTYSCSSPILYSDVDNELHTIAMEQKFLDELDLLYGSDFGDIELSKIFNGEQKQDSSVRNVQCISDSDIQNGVAHGIFKTEINLDSGTELQNSQQAVHGNEHSKINGKFQWTGLLGMRYDEKQSLCNDVHGNASNQNEAVDQSDLITEQASDSKNMKGEKCDGKKSDVSPSEPNHDNILTNCLRICDKNLYAVQREGSGQNSNTDAGDVDDGGDKM